ncbi:MAG: FAD:protein FMN transferase [Liquorilactobacillus nagelii]
MGPKQLDYQFYDRLINEMNLPFTLTLVCEKNSPSIEQEVNQLAKQIQQNLQDIDRIFSPFKQDSLLKRYQQGDLQVMQNKSFRTVFGLAEMAAKLTTGFFDPYYAAKYDPTGLVKGWSIEEIFNKLLVPFLLQHSQVVGISLNGGGDLQFRTRADSAFYWEVGIENPNNLQKLSAVYQMKDGAIATSGFSKRGQHIANLTDHSLLQATIITDSLTWADIWATAALTAGRQNFLELLKTNQLSGVLITPTSTIPFSKGRLADAAENSI